MAKSTRFGAWHAAAFLAGVGALSAVSSRKELRGYWRGLNRPARSAPVWVYPAVWTGLNVLQLWADLRILNDREGPDRPTLLGLRAVSWLVYGLFTPTFFGASSAIPGEAVSLAEGVTTGATVALLAKRDPLAAALLAPMTLWTAYTSLFGPETATANSDQLIERMRWEGAL